MSKYAIFLDIDGTLTNRNHIPSVRVIDALRKVQEAGHKIILNSGRGSARVKMFEDILSPFKPDGIICAMGQYIELEGRIVRCDCLSEESIRKMEEIVSSQKFEAWFEGIDETYRIPGSVGNVWDSEKYAEPDEKSYKRLLKITALGRLEEKDKENLEKELVVYQHADYFEAAVKGYSKAEGMLYALDKLGLSVENSIAIGDSANDEDMIAAAGIGVAMGNATEKVKEVADYITETNDNDGVATALDKLLSI